MKTAVFITCLVGFAYAYPLSDSNSSPMDSPESHLSDSYPDTSSSEEYTMNPANITLMPLTDQPRGDSLRRKRAVRQYLSSSESHSRSNSYPDSSSSSEEYRHLPTPEGTTAGQALTDNLRRKRSVDQKPQSSSSEQSSSESTTTSESTSSQSPSSSEEDSHERSTKQNLLQGIQETSTVPDTSSEESSEERTTPAPVFQP